MIHMSQEERLSIILNYLKTHKEMSIQSICHQLSISRTIARNDILKLLEQKQIVVNKNHIHI